MFPEDSGQKRVGGAVGEQCETNDDRAMQVSCTTLHTSLQSATHLIDNQPLMSNSHQHIHDNDPFLSLASSSCESYSHLAFTPSSQGRIDTNACALDQTSRTRHV